jgi:hypothetical protein
LWGSGIGEIGSLIPIVSNSLRESLTGENEREESGEEKNRAEDRSMKRND